MELSELVKDGAKKFSSDAALARFLGVDPVTLNKAKKGERPLPLAACGKLAELLEMERFEVAAASDLLTEKNEQRRAYLIPFARHVAGIMGIAVMSNFALPSPAEAEPLSHFLNNYNGIMYIM